MIRYATTLMGGDLHLGAIYPYFQAEATEFSAQPSVQDGMDILADTRWAARSGTIKIFFFKKKVFCFCFCLSAEGLENWHVETRRVLWPQKMMLY